MLTTFTIVAPRHSHDCDCCTFVGYNGPEDVYQCGGSIIRRFGSNGEDYQSFPINIARQIGADYSPALALLDNYRPLQE